LAAGPQTPGTMPVQWDGKDAMGNPVPPGLYRFKAKAVVNGTTTDVAVNTMSTVRSVVSSASDGALSLELDGGKSVLLSDIKRFGM
jgi:flagellar basal-body rod modification protein FlgD